MFLSALFSKDLVSFQIDVAALLVLICYSVLHVHQNLDARDSLSETFAKAVAQNRLLLLVSFVCLVLLLFVLFLWASSSASKVGLCPIEDSHATKIQFLNVVCAGIGLFGGLCVLCSPIHICFFDIVFSSDRDSLFGFEHYDSEHAGYDEYCGRAKGHFLRVKN